jgi:hypothetical protein
MKAGASLPPSTKEVPPHPTKKEGQIGRPYNPEVHVRPPLISLLN